MTQLPLSSHDDDLARLTQALDDADVDLGELFDQLTVSARASVASLCGLSITFEHERYPVTLTSLDHLGEGTLNAGAVTSLGIPLGAVTAAATAMMELFATAPDAFVDLARVTGTEAGVLQLDGSHVRSAHGVPIGVAAFSAFNRAIGALIERGFTPEQALACITGNADATGQHLATSAAEMLYAVVP